MKRQPGQTRSYIKCQECLYKALHTRPLTASGVGSSARLLDRHIWEAFACTAAQILEAYRYM